MDTQAFFSRHLAQWLFHVDWHYRSLLGIAIECVRDLPDDCDALIHALLTRHPDKPSEKAINDFLQSSERLTTWFKFRTSAPKIHRFNLAHSTFKGLKNSPLAAIDTPGDLANWLGLEKTELDWFANVWRIDQSTPHHLQHYRYQLLEKRDGKMRLIEQPKTTLKTIQRKINKDILEYANTHPAAHGFCKGKSCLSHASIHTGKQYLLTFDIAECFQSIQWPKVYSVFKQMGYPANVSTYLATLCTHRVRLKKTQYTFFDQTQKHRLKQRHLPQGAPTSPALANAALQHLDVRLSGLAKSLDLSYSRYADDIAMSGQKHRDWRFLEPLIGSICLEEGLTLNYKKTRIKRSHQKQRLVGIVVNKKVNVDRRYFDNLKATLTNCKRHGLDSQNREQHPQFRAQLLGRIQYVKSLNEQRGLKLERLYREIDSV